MKEKPLLEKNVYAQVLKRIIYIGWIPGIRSTFSKISFYRNKLVVSIWAFKTFVFELDYKDVDFISNEQPIGIRITHHNKNIDKFVYIQGYLWPFKNLFDEIKAVASKNNLKIKIKEN